MTFLTSLNENVSNILELFIYYFYTKTKKTIDKYEERLSKRLSALKNKIKLRYSHKHRRNSDIWRYIHTFQVINVSCHAKIRMINVNFFIFKENYYYCSEIKRNLYTKSNEYKKKPN